MTKTYAFEGNIIRLTKKHYEQWWHSFCAHMPEPNYLRELSSIDDWLASKPSTHKNWFFITSSMLEKNNRSENWHHKNPSQQGVANFTQENADI